jgi:Zn-dependent peptidase ImmA (M78 family)/transcriptional regulator with XRE-family HTH domain
MQVQVRPELLRWARERARLDMAALVARFPNYAAWEQGTKQPTLKQLETFAKKTYIPIGFLFLPQPPVERVPIPDLRTRNNQPIQSPSPNLLDTLYHCQQRQAWYREYVRWGGEPAQSFVGSVRISDDVVQVAAQMRRTLGFDLNERATLPTWQAALQRMIEQADAASILVMVSGIVGSDTHRKLDPDEFGGFALADPFAPLVFVNGADTQAAQIFTLAHELAHLWLGESALSSLNLSYSPDIVFNIQPQPHEINRIEQFCNRVAAELLAPLDLIREKFDHTAPLDQAIQKLARLFKVSALVILRRLRDANMVSQEIYWQAYGETLKKLDKKKKDDGGDFYKTLNKRVGHRFGRAVVVSALEGRASFTEACRLLGFRSMTTFDEFGRQIGVIT